MQGQSPGSAHSPDDPVMDEEPSSQWAAVPSHQKMDLENDHESNHVQASSEMPYYLLPVLPHAAIPGPARSAKQHPWYGDSTLAMRPAPTLCPEQLSMEEANQYKQYVAYDYIID